MIHKYLITPSRNISFNKIIEAQKKLTDLRLEYYKKYELFEPQWWFLLAVLVIPLFVWWKLVDKERFFQIAFLGLLVFFISIEFDMAGIELSLWQYPHKLMPLAPRLLPIDLSALPVLCMLIYQYFREWKPYIIASLIGAAFSAFVVEPIFVYMGIYKLLSWEYWYSFPIYFVIFVALKWFVDSLEAKYLNR